ncbi:MAG: ECF transporter S component [Clostridia bacterium]|nr:ECF transporter S component [Clostridia bacterium]
MQKNISLKKVIQTALFIAITLILRNFSYMFYFGGGTGMRVGLSTFFSKLPALLFGPLYGGIADGVIDVLAYIIKPEGGYMPLLTLTAILGGVMVGFLWKYAKNINDKMFKNIFAAAFTAILIFGATNWILSSFYPDFAYSSWLLGFKKLSFFTVWPTLAGILALVLFMLDTLLREKLSVPNDFIKLFTVLFTANIIVTTLNTLILMLFIPSLSEMGFIAFYIPRFIEECIMTILQSYVISYLLKVYNKLKF